MINGRIFAVGIKKPQKYFQLRDSYELVLSEDIREISKSDQVQSILREIEKAYIERRPYHIVLVGPRNHKMIVEKITTHFPKISTFYMAEKADEIQNGYEVLINPPEKCLREIIKRTLTENVMLKKDALSRLIPRRTDQSNSFLLKSYKSEIEDGYHPGCETLIYELQGLKVSIISLFLTYLQERNVLCLSPSHGCVKRCPKCNSWRPKEHTNRNFTWSEMVGLIVRCLNRSFYFGDLFWLDERSFTIAVMGTGDFSMNFSNVMIAMEKIWSVFKSRLEIDMSTAFSAGIRKTSAYVKSGKGSVVPFIQASFDSLDKKTREKMVDSKEDPKRIISAAAAYYELTKQRITANFVLAQGINEKEAKRIKEQLDPEIFKIQLTIGHLPTGLKPSEVWKAKQISDELQKAGFETDVFVNGVSLIGRTISADCGNVAHC